MDSIYLFFGGILFSVIVYFFYWLFTDDKSNAIIKNLEQELKELRKKHLDLLNDYRTLYSKYARLDEAFKRLFKSEQATVEHCNKYMAEKDEKIASLKKSFNAFANSCRGMYEIDCKSPFILKIGGSRHICTATQCEASRDVINPNKSNFTISGRISESVYTKMPDSFADTLKIVSDDVPKDNCKKYHINNGSTCTVTDEKLKTRFVVTAHRPIDVYIKSLPGEPLDVVSIKDSNCNSREYVVRGDGIF